MMRAKIGQIRPDVSCNISFLASKLKAVNAKDLLTVNKVINEIKGIQYNIEYQPLGGKIKIVLFAVAAFADH